MIKLVWELRAMNALAKFENDPWKFTNVRALMGLDRPAARPLGLRQYRGALTVGVKTFKGSRVKTYHALCLNIITASREHSQILSTSIMTSLNDRRY